MRHWKLFWISILVAGLSATACSGVKGKLECATDDDCHNTENGEDGIQYACDVSTSKICLRVCTEANESENCLASQVCDVPAGDTTGLCRTGTTPATDGGDSGGGDGGDPAGD